MDNSYLPLYRQIYRKYLDKYWLFRLVKKAILAMRWNCYSFIISYYYLLIRSINTKKYDLVGLREYLLQNNCKKIHIEQGGEYFVNPPKFSNNVFFTEDKSASIKLVSPAICVYFINDAEVMAGTNFIFKSNLVIHPDEFVPEIEVCPSETAKICSISPDYTGINFSSLHKAVEIKQLSASLLGQCAGNYAHWLTEVLPKLAVLDSLDGYRDIPLIVDGWVHPNFYESIDLLCSTKRELIKVGRWERVNARSLLGISSTSYIPAESRKFIAHKKFINDEAMKFSFSKFSINLMKEKILKKIPTVEPTIEKIFIRRESTFNGRNAINADELEKIALEFGYTVVEPGKMSFSAQVALFRGVKVIAGQIGAALSNAIFSEQCKLIILSPYYENANYSFFANLMGILGHDLTYVIGPQVEESKHVLHRNYLIEPKDFRNALQKVAQS